MKFQINDQITILQHLNDNIAISSKYACGFYYVATKVASFFFMVPQTQPQLAKQKYKKVQYSIAFSLLCEYTPPLNKINTSEA